MPHRSHHHHHHHRQRPHGHNTNHVKSRPTIRFPISQLSRMPTAAQLAKAVVAKRLEACLNISRRTPRLLLTTMAARLAGEYSL